MDVVREVARALVQENSATSLRRVVISLGQPAQAGTVGHVCGDSCGPPSGNVCGQGCTSLAGSFLVDGFDQEGRLGLTRKDLDDVRNNLPALRQAITEELQNALREVTAVP
jgi:hypothetical protein